MEDPNMSYRELHERFMQNHTGTSVEETISVQTTIPFTIFITVYLVNALKSHLHNETLTNRVVLIFTEFLLLVFMQILIFMSPYSHYFICVLYGTGLYLMIRCVLRCIKQCVAYKSSSIKLKRTELVGKRPYITYFRTSVNLTTTICILAVDFQSFPRMLAKTESYGFSLMDTGVGYFVVCNALVASHTYKCDIDRIGRCKFLLRLLRQNVILIILGLVRFISTESVEYQKHHTEYGVHWNFFLTLACTKIIALFFLTFFTVKHVKFLAIFIIFIHQTVLAAGLEKWVLSNIPRNNFLYANREGLVSLLGYVGLYLASVEIQNKLQAKSTTVEKDGKMILNLGLSAFLLYILVVTMNSFFQSSRRLANATYVLWILMLTCYLLFWCLLFEILLRFWNGLKQLKNSTNLVPNILESINYNALLYFLAANIFTGLVNLAIETLYVSPIFSIGIVTVYMAISVSFVTILYYKKIKLNL